MIDVPIFIIASLATYRLARMVATEEGPFGVFVVLRGFLDADQKTWLGRGMVCQLCVGFWLALPVAFLVAPLDWTLLLAWWGIAGAAALLAKWEGKR
jgi:hypothetical protein